MNSYRTIVINPGSTSTKIAVYDNQTPIYLKNIKHKAQELAQYKSIAEQYPFRRDIIFAELQAAEIDLSQVKAVIGRGGLLKPIPSGVYRVNQRMKDHLQEGIMGQHASNLGGLIASELANTINPSCQAFIADPVVVDELQAVARISGLPEMPRQSIFHALNQKAVARQFAQSRGKDYQQLNLVVAHLGGGISVGTHAQGKVIDVNNGLDGYGPLSPERAGTLPTGALIDLCYSGQYSQQQMRNKIVGQGGFVAHLGTNEAYEVDQQIQQGNTHAQLIMDAMCYQVGKAIGSGAAVLHGKIDGIIITGGVAHSNYAVQYIKKMVSFLAPIAVYPGEDEMTALMQNALLVLTGKAQSKEYQ